MKMKFNLNGKLTNLGILTEDQSGNMDINLELEFAPEEFKDVLKYQLEVMPQVYNMIKEVNQINQHEQEQAKKIYDLEREKEKLWKEMKEKRDNIKRKFSQGPFQNE